MPSRLLWLYCLYKFAVWGDFLAVVPDKHLPTHSECILEAIFAFVLVLHIVLIIACVFYVCVCVVVYMVYFWCGDQRPIFQANLLVPIALVFNKSKNKIKYLFHYFNILFVTLDVISKFEYSKIGSM